VAKLYGLLNKGVHQMMCESARRVSQPQAALLKHHVVSAFSMQVGGNV